VAPADGLDEAARDLEQWERAGIQMVCVETADDVFAGLQRLASEPTDLIWA